MGDYKCKNENILQIWNRDNDHTLFKLMNLEIFKIMYFSDVSIRIVPEVMVNWNLVEKYFRSGIGFYKVDVLLSNNLHSEDIGHFMYNKYLQNQKDMV